MLVNRFLVVVCLCASTIQLRTENLEYIKLKSRKDTGLFSMCSDVLALLHYYEKGYYSGVEVAFGDEGLYYDIYSSPNWWDFYFEPIQVGEKTSVRECVYEHIPNISKRDFWSSRHEAHYLINKYIHVLPHISEQVDAFQKEHFNSNYTIGVHYRGTDADNEPSYQMFLEKIQAHIASLGQVDYKIFIATDEFPFIDFMQAHFPNRICYQTDVYRAPHQGKALHTDASRVRSKQGEEAIIDCLLLSKCHLLFLTNSNLSLFAAQLSPDTPVIPVSDVFDAYLNRR